MSGQYDQWFATQLKEFIDAIVNQTDFNSIIQEIERGLQHAETNPGDISPVLLEIGRLRGWARALACC